MRLLQLLLTGWSSSSHSSSFSRFFDLLYSFVVVERQQLNERQPTAVDVLKVAFAFAFALDVAFAFQ